MPLLWPPRPGDWQPFHVVNIALNVVNAKRLAWQERKAESFTVTPLHCGTAELGYRPSDEYGDKQRGGMSLGTALAISGAAASPNMGYHSSPIVSLMLALFNVRLGWWLGQSGPKGAPHYYQSTGRWSRSCRSLRKCSASRPRPPLRLSLRRRPFRESRPLRNDPAPLPLHRRERCRVAIQSTASRISATRCARSRSTSASYVRFGKLHELKARSKDSGVIKGAYYAVGEIDYKTAPEWKSSADTRKRREERLHPLHQAELSRHRERRHRGVRDGATPPFRTKRRRTSSSASRSSRATARSASRSWTACSKTPPRTSTRLPMPAS